MEKNESNNNENAFIRCPRCELNFIHKKDKLCSVCKKELEQAFVKDDESDLDMGVDFDICPVCKAPASKFVKLDGPKTEDSKKGFFNRLKNLFKK